MAKGRVKFDEFTKNDRDHLLDLFVNNEKTLLQIYEILFPKTSFKSMQKIKGASDKITLNDVSMSGFDLKTMAQSPTEQISIGKNSDFINSTIKHQQSGMVGDNHFLSDITDESIM